MVKILCSENDGKTSCECQMTANGSPITQLEEAVCIVRRLYYHFENVGFKGAGEAFMRMCENAVKRDETMRANGTEPFTPVDADAEKEAANEYIN